jgi:hypothetical protein
VDSGCDEFYDYSPSLSEYVEVCTAPEAVPQPPQTVTRQEWHRSGPVAPPNAAHVAVPTAALGTELPPYFMDDDQAFQAYNELVDEVCLEIDQWNDTSAFAVEEVPTQKATRPAATAADYHYQPEMNAFEEEDLDLFEFCDF